MECEVKDGMEKVGKEHKYLSQRCVTAAMGGKVINN